MTDVAQNKGLGTLFDVPFDSDEYWNTWLLDHELTHVQIYGNIIGQGLKMNHYPLSDVNLKNSMPWLMMHQDEHQQIYDLLGLTGLPDLTTVNFDDERQWQAWHDLHRDVHVLINTTLGL